MPSRCKSAIAKTIVCLWRRIVGVAAWCLFSDGRCCYSGPQRIHWSASCCCHSSRCSTKWRKLLLFAMLCLTPYLQLLCLLDVERRMLKSIQGISSIGSYSCSKLLNSCGHSFSACVKLHSFSACVKLHSFSACVKLFSFSDQFCPKRWPSSSRSPRAPLKSARPRTPNASYLRSSQGV